MQIQPANSEAMTSCVGVDTVLVVHILKTDNCVTHRKLEYLKSFVNLLTLKSRET
jgi:hypothetical protein